MLLKLWFKIFTKEAGESLVFMRIGRYIFLSVFVISSILGDIGGGKPNFNLIQ